MTVAQMKHYLKPGALQKLDNAELGQLLSASRGIRDHFAKERGLDASLETAYWNAAEKEIVREFRNRNISVTVMTFADVYSSLNELLESGNCEAKTAIRKIISQYDTAALLDIKADDGSRLSKTVRGSAQALRRTNRRRPVVTNY